MSDVRSLLKAKRQEIRVEHPLASYTSAGQLRCTVCDMNIKHPSAWDGHLGSKAHRTNAARVREEEKRRKELELAEEANRLKRKASEAEEDAQGTTKKSKVASASASWPSTSSLPPNFFSDPSRAPVASLDDEGDSDDEETRPMTVDGKPTGGGGDSLDREWMHFQRSVIDAPDAAAAYDRATIAAEPELAVDQSEGLPAVQDATGAETSPVTRTDEDERRRKEQEERELVMDRLMDEERAQEEADMKVSVMKNRLAALRQKRAGSRLAKPNVDVA